MAFYHVTKLRDIYIIHLFLFVDSLNIHRFPTNKASRSSWATYIGRNEWEPKKDDRICSDHFKEEDLIRIESKVQIRKFAHPTRFKFRPKNSHTSDHEYCKPVANQDQVNQEQYKTEMCLGAFKIIQTYIYGPRVWCAARLPYKNRLTRR